MTWVLCARFGFSKWAVSLNDAPPGLDALLPPSDVRKRQDIRLLEQGRYAEVRVPIQAPLWCSMPIHMARACMQGQVGWGVGQGSALPCWPA